MNKAKRKLEIDFKQIGMALLELSGRHENLKNKYIDLYKLAEKMSLFDDCDKGCNFAKHSESCNERSLITSQFKVFKIDEEGF
jgi:hypothetical protein